MITTGAILATGIIIFVISSIWIFPSLWGSQSLGKDLYLVAWDGGGCVMMYSSRESLFGNVCENGTIFIPAEYNPERERIIKEAHDDNWIVAETRFEHSGIKKYYIVSKDFNPNDFRYFENDSLSLKRARKKYCNFENNNVKTFNDSLDFVRHCKINGIKLNLKKPWIYWD